MELTDQQINEQSPSSLKVISQLNIDCHQVTAIYNRSTRSQQSASLGLELSYVPASQGAEPALSRKQGPGLPCAPQAPALIPSRPHISGSPASPPPVPRGGPHHPDSPDTPGRSCPWFPGSRYISTPAVPKTPKGWTWPLVHFLAIAYFPLTA